MANGKVKNETYDNECIMVPLTDIYETDDEYTLKLEMPGVLKENLDVILANNELEVKGITEKFQPEGKELKYSENADYNYYRKFHVGNDIDRNGIDAKLENGVLTLSLKKSEEVKPKKIEISVN